jgi:hypothetical protein
MGAQVRDDDVETTDISTAQGLHDAYLTSLLEQFVVPGLAETRREAASLSPEDSHVADALAPLSPGAESWIRVREASSLCTFAANFGTEGEDSALQAMNDTAWLSLQMKIMNEHAKGGARTPGKRCASHDEEDGDENRCFFGSDVYSDGSLLHTLAGGSTKAGKCVERQRNMRPSGVVESSSHVLLPPSMQWCDGSGDWDE